MQSEDFTQAVRRYSDMVLKICYSYSKSMSDAEDITQNVFIKLYRHNDCFNDQNHLKNWLVRAAIDESNSYLSSAWYRRKAYSIDDESLEKMPSNFKLPEQSELFQAVRSLPTKYRVVVHLYYYEDYDTAEIADMLHIKVTTVQTRLMRARNKLKQRLSEADYEF